MKRRTFFSMIVAVIAIIFSAFSGATEAKAQCPVDCTYLITASCSIPPHCFPLQVTTAWNQGMMNAVQTHIIPQCGTFAYPQPQPCPPLWNIAWASLDGGMTIAIPNGAPVKYFLAHCNTWVCLSITISPTGCVNVIIVPC